ncbi:MAG: response regulator [Desulfobacteraceae bacterium]|nr:response regulator [Desulfobacteraceae bacterium]
MSASSNETYAAQILVVNDSRFSLKLLREILVQHSYTVRIALSGRQALEPVAIKIYDLILLDVKTGDLNGYEVCRRLKTQAVSRDVPVIFISSGVFRDHQRNPIGLVANLTDITKTKQAEKKIRQLNEDLEIRLAERTGALAQGTDLTRQQADYLPAVKISADHLLKISPGHLIYIINEILDFSKMEAGYLDLEQIGYRMREIMEDAVDTLAVNAHKKNQALKLDVAPEAPNCLIGDPVRLRQILVNLLNNAIKFNAAGKIAVSCQAGEADGKSALLDFKVPDTGTGFPKNQIKQIFESFQQADDTQTDRQKSNLNTFLKEDNYIILASK